jgi:large subunit ribosomal protein L19
MTILSKIKISPVDVEARKRLDLRAGDIVKVHQKIKEGDKFRIQVFEGLVLSRKHKTEPGATFTVRKVVDGVGVERIFPLYSPLIEKIEFVKRSKVRRAKIYHVRRKASKEIKRKMRNLRNSKEDTTDNATIASSSVSPENTKGSEEIKSNTIN